MGMMKTGISERERLEKLLEIALVHGFDLCTAKVGWVTDGIKYNTIADILFSNPKDGVGFVEALCLNKFKEKAKYIEVLISLENGDLYQKSPVSVQYPWYYLPAKEVYLCRLSCITDSDRLVYLAKEFLDEQK